MGVGASMHMGWEILFLCPSYPYRHLGDRASCDIDSRRHACTMNNNKPHKNILAQSPSWHLSPNDHCVKEGNQSGNIRHEDSLSPFFLSHKVMTYINTKQIQQQGSTTLCAFPVHGPPHQSCRTSVPLREFWTCQICHCCEIGSKTDFCYLSIILELRVECTEYLECFYNSRSQTQSG